MHVRHSPIWTWTTYMCGMLMPVRTTLPMSGENRLCEPYDSISVKGVQVEFLAEDPSIQCGESEHARLQIISYFLIFLW